MIPEHYSRDIALRCNSLIDSLMPIVLTQLSVNPRFGGALGTTFLLAMGTPMIILPVERLLKHVDRATADDRSIDSELAERVSTVFGEGRKFGDAPFARLGAWSYVRGHKWFNIAGTWPRELLRSLSSPEAIENARTADAKWIVTDLRNALAHGSIAYLDEDGQQTAGQAAMLAFAGAVIKDSRITALNVLRIHEQEYRRFLSAWAAWLTDARLTEDLNLRAA